MSAQYNNDICITPNASVDDLNTSPSESTASTFLTDQKQQPQLNIDIYSDVICPWCYVGTKRLQSALTSFINESKNNNSTDVESSEGNPIQVNINYHPFELDETLPKESMDKKEYLVKRFGRERVTQMGGYLKRVGETVGINFADEGRIGNTLKAHQASTFIRQTKPEVANEFMYTLFQRYFEDGKDITDDEVLIQCATSVGVEREQITQALASEKHLKDVQTEIEKAKRKGIHGVPHFIINNNVRIEGAEEPIVFKNAFRKLVNAQQNL